MKYVFHVDHVQDWTTALSNMKNTVGQGDNEIVAVINGTAVYAVQGISDWTQAMQQLAEAGVRFEICSNALTGHHIPRETLPEWLMPIPSAIAALGEYQQQGFAYIKP